MEILHWKPINPSETLIIFDEIQACPEAITALKYFYEEAPEYYVFAAGSMLGVAIHQGVSFPVGKVSFLPLYPLSFHEFLEASGAQSLLQAIVNDQLDILQMLALELLNYYKMYCFLGGMPEVLNNYFEYNDLYIGQEGYSTTSFNPMKTIFLSMHPSLSCPEYGWFGSRLCHSWPKKIRNFFIAC